MRGAQFENGGAFRDGRDLQVIIDTIILIAINILGKKHSEFVTIFGVTIFAIILIVLPWKNPSKILRSSGPHRHHGHDGDGSGEWRHIPRSKISTSPQLGLPSITYRHHLKPPNCAVFTGLRSVGPNCAVLCGLTAVEATQCCLVT